jgi:hypothetical protein
LGLLAQQRFEKWVDQKREETQGRREAFCQAIIENDLLRISEEEKRGFFASISRFFSCCFRKAPEEAEKNECGERLTQKGYVESVGGRDKNVMQRIIRVTIETLIRCSTAVTRTTLPLFLIQHAKTIQKLQTKFQKLSQEQQQHFSLLDTKQDEGSKIAQIFSQTSFEQRFRYRFFPPLFLWNRASKIALALLEMQGEKAEEMWGAFNNAANHIRMARFR